MIRVDYIGLCWLFLQLVNCVGFWTAWIVILICVWVWFVFCNVTGWHRWGIHSHTKYHLHHFSRENNSAPNIDFNFNRKPFPWHLFTTDFAYVAISAFHGNPSMNYEVTGNMAVKKVVGKVELTKQCQIYGIRLWWYWWFENGSWLVVQRDVQKL